MAGVRITGLRQSIRSLEKLGVQVADLKDMLFKVSSKTVNDAKQLTPVRSGRLQASIRPSKAKNKVTIRGGSRAVNYASFVEYGSVHNEAVGMVTEAITSNEQYTAHALDTEIQSLVRRYGLN